VASVIFSGIVLQQTIRVVDLGSPSTPRIVVEIRQPADSLGGYGWATMDPISRATLEALLLAAHVIT
jgi:hypothetical protein